MGDQVTLRWTTPERTTDKLLISGPITAEICRETIAAGPAVNRPAAAQGSTRSSGGNAVPAPCSPVVERVQVQPGESEEVDPLPPTLSSGPARLLAYQVQLLNAAGRTAGASPAVYAASGPAPLPVEGLQGHATKAGAMLEWKAEVQGTGNREQGAAGGATVELERTTVEAAADAGPGPAAAAQRKGVGLTGAPKDPVEVRFRVGAAATGAVNGAVDAGGTIDRTAEIGHTYRYSAQRVASVVLGGQTLEVRSVTSAEVTVPVQDVFPPDAPEGLVAVPEFSYPSAQGSPGTAGEGESGKPAKDLAIDLAIDLSWEPNMEARIAGYRVYRRDLDGDAPDMWRQLDAEPVAVAAYLDLTVTAGHRYAYRVTAVSGAGHESAPSAEAMETAPAQ
jgi:hypothetical protein